MDLTHQTLLAKNLPSPVRKLHRRDTNFPPQCAPIYFYTHSATNDLVAKADAYEADAALCEDCLGEIDEFEDPGGRVEGVLTFREVLSADQMSCREYRCSVCSASRLKGIRRVLGKRWMG